MYVIVLNDGTDEIFNMYNFKAETYEEAIAEVQEWFGEDAESLMKAYPDEEYSEEQRLGADRFFIEVSNEAMWETILHISDDRHKDGSLERAMLEGFYQHVIMENCIKVEGNGKYWGLKSLKRIYE